MPRILIDRVDKPTSINLLTLEVVDRIDPPSVSTMPSSTLLAFVDSLVKTLHRMKLSSAFLVLPDTSMAFYNTQGIASSLGELADLLSCITGLKSLQFLLLSQPALLARIPPSFMHAVLQLALTPQACNRFVSLPMTKQYFNWFLEYLINTFPGSPRFLPMTMQEEGSRVGLGKEERQRGTEIEGQVKRDEARMRAAESMSGYTGYNVDICYKVYRVGDCQ